MGSVPIPAITDLVAAIIMDSAIAIVGSVTTEIAFQAAAMEVNLDNLNSALQQLIFNFTQHQKYKIPITISYMSL